MGGLRQGIEGDAAGCGSAPAGTVDEMAQIFTLVESAWAEVIDGVYGISRDRGLQETAKLLGLTAKLQANKLTRPA